MTTLYIDRRHASLVLEGKALVVRFNGVRQRPVPLALLERVVLLVNVELSSGVLLGLADAGVMVQLGSPRKPQRRALLLGRGHNDAGLRLLQYRLVSDAQWRLAASRILVAAKLRGQSRLLGRMLAERPDQRKVLSDALAQVEAALLLVAEVETRDTLLGLEGSAARAFFGALAAVLPDNPGFSGRKRRPPPDAVNAALSLAYTLLHGRAVQMIHAAGLDPLLGFYHELAWGRESLASDLIEPWRPHIDEWVWDQFRKQQLRAHHFKVHDGVCLLGKDGRGVFFGGLEAVLRPVSRGLRWQVRGLIRDMEAWHA